MSEESTLVYSPDKAPTFLKKTQTEKRKLVYFSIHELILLILLTTRLKCIIIRNKL